MQFKYAKYIYFTSVTQLVASLALHFSLLSAMTLAEYGVYAFATACVSISVGVSRLGVNFNIILSVREGLEYKHNLWIYIGILSGLAAILTYFICVSQSELEELNAAVLSMFAAATLVNQAIISDLQGKEKFHSYCTAKVVDSLVTIILTIFLFSNAIENVNYLFGYFFISLFIQNIIFSDYTFLSSTKYLSFHTLRRCVADSLKFAPGAISKDVSQRLDVLIIQTFSGLEAVGLFSLVIKIVEAIGRVPDSIAVVLLPALVKGRRDARIAVYTIWSAVITAVCGLAAPSMLEFVMSAINPEVNNHLLVFYYCVPGAIIISISKIWINNLIATGDSTILNVTQLTSIVIKIAVGSLGGYLFGFYGVMFAWTLSNAVTLIIIMSVDYRSKT